MPASAGRTGTPRETACCGGWGSWAWPTGRCGRSPGVSSSGSRSRALAAHTPLLLLDEPLAALDALTRERLQEDIRTVSHETGRTSVFVTHSADEAVFLGSRIIVLTARPGRIALDLRVDLPRSGVDPDELRLTGVRGAAGAGGPRGQGRCVSRERAKAAFARIK